MSSDPKKSNTRGRGRPRKPSSETMSQRNVSLTSADEAALKRLAGMFQLSYYSLNNEAAEGISGSWAIRALIRYADRQTQGWRYGDPNKFLDLAVVLGMTSEPYGDTEAEGQEAEKRKND